MKYINSLYIFLAACAIAMTACTDDMPQRPGTPVETGDAIMFASMLNGDHEEVNVNHPETRTHYGERTPTGIPIRWDGGDRIAIFCPQASAPADHLVTYEITPSEADSTKSGSMIKVDTETVGLQWGSDNVHEFFGVYPASVVKETDQDDQSGIITATLPSTQLPKMWVERTEYIPGKGERKVYYGAPNMDYSLMLAYSAINKDAITDKTPINLKFHNLVTVLDIVVQGPEQGDSITVTNINVDVVEGENIHICGDFDIHMDKIDENKFTCKALDTDKVTNRISIPCYDAKKGKFITLGQNEVMVVKAFLIPDTQTPEMFRQFRITVASLNGSANRMTLKNHTTDKQQIKPRKINRILLPHLTKGNPAYWMSKLDPNIYLSELSIPGSKMSYLTPENNAKDVYQNKTISEQFKDGVRAFIVQTGAKCDYNLKLDGWKFNTSHNYSLPIVDLNNKDLKDTFKEIADELKIAQSNDKKNDFAVVMVTAQFEDVKGNPLGLSDERAWIETAKHYLTKLATEDPELKNYIYREEITNNTTIGDVAGKIVVKVNYNETNQEEWTSEADKTPALFTKWTAPTAQTPTRIAPMYWGWTGHFSEQTPTPTPKMMWNYQEVTIIGNKVGPGQSQATLETKENSIKKLFTDGVAAYQNDAKHMNWFMNDLGGKFYDKGEIPDSIPSAFSTTEAIAYHINDIAVRELQTRTENASIGLIFMNFADRASDSGARFKSDYLLATIIDNNFKFALRKRQSTPTPPLR